MKNGKIWVLAILGFVSFTTQAFAEEESLNILRQGLLGAGVGAISSGASGGKAGQGALIGAGTSVIGNALFGLLLAPSSSQNQQAPAYYPQPAPTYYSQPAPVYYQVPQPQPVQVQVQQPVYTYRTERVFVQPQPRPQPVYYSYAPQQEDPNRSIIKQGLLGAGVGAVSSYASGGKGGKGALIGAGTNVIGGALLQLLTGK